MIKQPCFDEMRTSQIGYRVVGALKYTDEVMNYAFWIGVYPGMSEAILSYMSDKIHAFVKKKR